jgi:hypothetical protein
MPPPSSPSIPSPSRNKTIHRDSTIPRTNVQEIIPDRRHPRNRKTFEGNQTNRRLISFKVSGRSFQGRFLAMPPAWVELSKKQPIETKAVESLKEIEVAVGPIPF